MKSVFFLKLWRDQREQRIKSFYNILFYYCTHEAKYFLLIIVFFTYLNQFVSLFSGMIPSSPRILFQRK